MAHFEERAFQNEEFARDVWTCPRCGEKFIDKDEADGCRDPQCSALEPDHPHTGMTGE